MVGVHVDVHGEWIMLWVAAMYNVLAILTMADMPVFRNCGVHEQCWVCVVCMVCMLYGLYGMLEFKLCCEMLLHCKKSLVVLITEWLPWLQETVVYFGIRG